MKAYIVAGLGFGDEGKGTIVDALVKKTGAKLVVRYNGGAQAAHHVVKDGQSHCFAQFGSGTLHGAFTYLSRFVTIDPAAIVREANHLRELGVARPLEHLLYIDPGCPVVTPWHRAMNQLREVARGSEAHGSCGRGIGEVAADIANNRDILRASDLLAPGFRAKADAIYQRLLAEAQDLNFDQLKHPAWDALTQYPTRWCTQTASTARLLQIKPPVGTPDTIVFEGAQGVLLDETFGFYPHTTWSDCTFHQAGEVIEEQWRAAADTIKIGVTRSFLTRHGAGPLPTECQPDTLRLGLLTQEHNGTNDWQRTFRTGALDLVLLRYACAVAKPDMLAITHLDQVTDNWPVAVLYEEGPAHSEVHNVPVRSELVDRQRWGQRLRHVRPVLVDRRASELVQSVQRSTAVPVGIASYGPTADDKHYQSEGAHVG